MKRCSECLKIKPISDFYRKLSTHQNWCKQCNPEVFRKYRAKRKNDRLHAKMREELFYDLKFS